MSALLLMPLLAHALVSPPTPNPMRDAWAKVTARLAPPPAVSCNSLLTSLFVDAAAVDPAAVSSACSPTVEWVDMNLDAPIRGQAAVEEHLASLYPTGSRLVVEKMSDGVSSGGFTWHREADGMDGVRGVRGVTYFELDDAGKISYVQEGWEPLFKLDVLLEALLQAANANKKDEAIKPASRSYERQSPKTAEGIVRYLWEVAYPGGATPKEALTFFSDDILYALEPVRLQP